MITVLLLTKQTRAFQLTYNAERLVVYVADLEGARCVLALFKVWIGVAVVVHHDPVKLYVTTREGALWDAGRLSVHPCPLQTLKL